MALYQFTLPVGPSPEPVELADDDAAWSEVVVVCGELLRDLDGKLAPSTDWSVTVTEGERRVAEIRIIASRE